MIKLNGKQYKVWTWKHFSLLHWIINPGIAINELIFGQRTPKELYFEQVDDKPLMERQFVRCPHCETMHDGRTWSKQNKTAFKNWFGLYCTNCGDTIPCLRNATAWLLLAITYPLWFWWIDKARQQWMEKQPRRYEKLTIQDMKINEVNWKQVGLLYGAGMFVFMTFIFPFILGTEITTKSILIAIPLWTITGILFALIMKWWMSMKAKKIANEST